MNPQQVQEAFELALRLTKQAGPLVLEGFRNASKAVDTKRTHFDVVTEYDRQVEQLLIGGLLGRYPDHRILAEESSSEAAAKEPLDGRPTWIIDPIDGTLNFVRGIPFVAISVALVVDGELTIGIISNPCMDEIYTAIQGQGAFLNGVAIRTKGIQDLKSAMVHMGIGRKSLAHGANFVRECSGLRIFGSAALTLAYIAAGSVDLYCVEWLKPWDIAAGALLVREAGGVVRGFGGGAYDIMKPDIVAASSEELAERALEVMGKSSG
ncbi:inositol monophosphatase 2-like [Culex pipiens pallens]|uniref:inositol monophosphatase 2-like n=1 Tax=Culex pipiens pallens TaxID=42434 RepID=UPI0019532D96|nr:inositol monophosphatase 2-like [Culex pipiens pallens]